MPEQTDAKRKSWWGILHTDRITQPDSPLGKQEARELPNCEELRSISDTSLDSQPAVALGGNNSNNMEGPSQTSRGVSSKLDMFKKQGLAKKASKSKFATVAATTATTNPWSATANGLHHINYSGSADALGSNTVSNNGLGHKSGFPETVSQYGFERLCNDDYNDTRLIFHVVEQQEPDGKVRERDVAYSIHVEGLTKILLLTRRISDFLDFDEKVKAQFPKARPALPLFDDRRKSFLVTTRQFFFPRKNTAEKLEAYLRKIASHSPLRNSDIFEEFLAVSEDGDLMHSKEKPWPPLVDSPLEPSTPTRSMEDLNEIKLMDDSHLRQQQQQHLYSSHGHQPQMPSVAPPPQQQHHCYPQQQQLPPLLPSVQSYRPQQQAGAPDVVPRGRGGGGKVRPAIPAHLQQQKLLQPPSLEQRHKVGFDDFMSLKVLGRGCMGKVLLVREKTTKKLFALKCISKEWVILQREIEHTKSERDILANVAKISHPFLIKLRHSFQDKSQLYMVLDYYPGGDIATQLAKWHRFVPERCLFYTAEIVLGIEELHRLGIVYRDLKPENILLALDGHIVLTDFGLSKQFPSMNNSNGYVNNEKTSTFCGTAEYLAPEILMAHEYSYEVDWWSLGTLLYEMLSGITPFWAENHAMMYRRVLEDDLEFPMGIDPDAASFIAGLLERNPVRRLGYGSDGARVVKRHAYFKSIDWHKALQRKLPCPCVPDLTSEEDLRNFDETFLTMTPRLTPGNHTLSNSIQNCFQGYSYTMASSALPTSGPGTLPRMDSKMQTTMGGAVSVQSSYKDHLMNHGPTPHQGSYRGGIYGNGIQQNYHNNIGNGYNVREQQQQLRSTLAGNATEPRPQHPLLPSMQHVSMGKTDQDTDVAMQEEDDLRDFDQEMMEEGDEDYSYENGQQDPDRVHEDLFGYKLDANNMHTYGYQQDLYNMQIDPHHHQQPQVVPRPTPLSSKYGTYRNSSYIPPSAAIVGVEIKGQATVDMHVQQGQKRRSSSSHSSSSTAAALASTSPSAARHTVHLTGLNIWHDSYEPAFIAMPGSPTTPTMAAMASGSRSSSSSIKALATSCSPSLPSIPDEAGGEVTANGRVIALAETTRSSGGASAAADILRGYSEGGARHNSTSSSRSSDTIGGRLSRSFL